MEFPGLMFFIKADPTMHARRRLRELLLLIARILILLFLLLALARPVLRNVPAADGDIALIIIVDNSASMDGLTPEGQSKLEVAREAARQLLDTLDAKAKAAIVPLTADPAMESTSQLTADRELLKETLERIRRTEAMGIPAEAFARARALLDQAPPAMGHAVHCFTDLHEAAWGRTGSNKAIFENLTVVFHRIPSERRNGANVTIESISAPNRPLLPRHAYKASFGLRNNSMAQAEIRINIRNRTDATTSQKLIIEPGMSETVHYPFTPEEPGDYWIMLELEGDAFRGDNRAGIALFCKPEAEVWFIGQRASYGLIPTAISPTGTGQYTSLRPVFKQPENFTQDIATDPPPLIVATWDSLPELTHQQAEELRQYVEVGGRLFVVPDTINRAGTPGPIPVWIGATPGRVRNPGDDPAVARILNRESEVWDGLDSALESGLLRFFLMRRYTELEVTADYRLLAGLHQRSPVLAEREYGEGNIYASGLAFDRQWTTLATDPSGIAVVMLHNIAKGGTSLKSGPKNLSVTAGEPVRIPSIGDLPTQIRSLIGDTVNTTILPGAELTTARAGAYRIENNNHIYLVSVKGSSEEASENFIESDKLAFMGSTPHHITPLDSSAEKVVQQLHAHFTERPLYLPLALLALLAWAVEAWLSTRHSQADQRSRVNP